MTTLRVALLALITLAPVLAAQSPPPLRPPQPQEPVATFRSSVRAIQVDPSSPTKTAIRFAV